MRSTVLLERQQIDTKPLCLLALFTMAHDMHAHPIWRQIAQAGPCGASGTAFLCAMSNMHCMTGTVDNGWGAWLT